MKIVTFNIRCKDDINGHSIPERAPRLLECINGCNPDIIGFQEVTKPWMEYIPADYGEKYDMFHKYRDTNQKEGCTVLWKRDKFELIDTGAFWYSSTPWVTSRGNDSYKRLHRICAYVILRERATDRRIAFFNTHFGFGDSYQIESMELLAKTVELLGEQNTVIVGDFNFTPAAPAYAKSAEYFDEANALLGNASPTTFHGYGRETDTRIDYMFLRRGGARVTSSRLLDNTYDGKYPSDHYGLCFEVELS